MPHAHANIQACHSTALVTASWLMSVTPYLVFDRISALDPVESIFLPNKLFPDFQDNPMARLYKTDARLVDEIHTDGDCLESLRRTGHVDIYPGTYKGYGVWSQSTRKSMLWWMIAKHLTEI